MFKTTKNLYVEMYVFERFGITESEIKQAFVIIERQLKAELGWNDVRLNINEKETEFKEGY